MLKDYSVTILFIFWSVHRPIFLTQLVEGDKKEISIAGHTVNEWQHKETIQELVLISYMMPGDHVNRLGILI